MKKSYIQPVLTSYGNVEQITQANFTNGNDDTVFNAQGNPVAQLQGSRDADPI